MSVWEKVFLSPLLVPVLLLLSFGIVWFFNLLGNWIGSALNQPKWIIFFVGLTLFILWDTFRYSSIHVRELEALQLSWPIFLTLEILVGLLIIPGYYAFVFCKKKYFNQFDFKDGEAAKFGFILVGISIHSLLFGYLDAELHQVKNPFGNSIRVWWSPQIIVFALLLATGNFLNNFRQHYRQLKEQGKALIGAQKKDLQSQSELAALQSRVNPHFLYNSLNSIASLAQEDPVKTEAMALALSKFYKYSTNRAGEHWATVQEELTLLENYLAIEKIRFGELLEVTIQCETGLKAQQIPRFILQPLVENAIKYGYLEADKKIKVKVLIAQRADQLLLQVMDSGPPFSETMDLGYGLHSIQQKLKLLYPNQHYLDFVNVPEKGVVITLPFKLN